MPCEKCESKLKHVVTPDPWSMGGKKLNFYINLILNQSLTIS